MFKNFELEPNNARDIISNGIEAIKSNQFPLSFRKLFLDFEV